MSVTGWLNVVGWLAACLTSRLVLWPAGNGFVAEQLCCWWLAGYVAGCPAAGTG